jgi:hypothetical protein
MNREQLRTLHRQINDLMVVGGATLTERQEDILYMALKTILLEEKNDDSHKNPG